MDKVELLSPAGNMECLMYAVKNGADAVYFGGKKFGARNFATNFDKEEIIKAIKYCHLYGVKVYITVNTLCFEEELEEVLQYIEFLYENQVDALIMQDLGLMSIVREKYPNLPIHASTQFHNHNSYVLKLLEKMGVKRAVLAREMSLNEIKKMNTSLDKEIFIHGALCVCYSGCCLFSAMHGKRSGNRGECVGSCRLPYKLLENNKAIKTNGDYILSTRSLCTIENIDKIIESGVASLKIEGRMKSKEYVGYITRLYRNKIDSYYKNKNIKVLNNEINNIKKLYNRELTSGYLFDNFGNKLMNIKTSNHIGTNLGTVLEIDKKKIRIKLKDNLSQGDGIRFDNGKGFIVNKLYDKNNKLVNKLSSGEIAIVDNKDDIRDSKEVRKTQDYLLQQEISMYEDKKIPVFIECLAKVNDKLKLSISDGINKITKTGVIVEVANKCEMTTDRIKKQLEKLGNTPFKAANTTINMDNNIYIDIKSLNELRRTCVEELINKRENIINYEVVKNKIEINNNSKNNNKLSLSVLARNEEQLNILIKNKVDYIYTDNIDLYKKYKNNNVYLKLDRVSKDLIDYSKENILATELGAVYKYNKNNNVNGDYFLNVTNSYTINYLKKLGINRITLSPEVDKNNLKLLSKYADIDLYIYGRVELMITKYCPMNMIINKDNKNCSLCLNNKYSLKDKDDNIYPMVTKNHITHILDCKIYNQLDNLEDYLNFGITSFRIDLYDESKEQIENLIKEIRDKYEYRYN